MKWLKFLTLGLFLGGCTLSGGNFGASQSGLPQWKATTTNSVGDAIGNAITPRTNQKVYINDTATTTGNFTLMGEFMPDGLTCANGEILKKTGVNDWDCAADGSGTNDWTDNGVYVTPTTTARGLLINAASSTVTTLVVNTLYPTLVQNVAGNNLRVITGDAVTPTDLSFESGNAASGNNLGGDISFTSGQGSGTQAGGSFSFSSGAGGETGAGGPMSFTSGAGGATSGNGGSFTIVTGDASGDGNGGIIYLTPGVGSGTGIDGNIELQGRTNITGNATTTGFFNIGTTNPTFVSSNGDLLVGDDATITDQFVLSGIDTATAGTNNDICISATGIVVNESTGTCVVSSGKFKHDIKPLNVVALDLISKLSPSSFIRNEDDIVRWGFIAEEVADVDSHLASYGIDGLPRGLDDHALIAITVKAIQELQDRINILEQELCKHDSTYGFCQ